MEIKSDTIILGDWVWPAPGKLLKDAAVVTGSGVIIEVGPQADLLPRYPTLKRVGGRGRFVMPGMISTHTHFFQTFLKGVGSGLTLRPWIKKVTSPASITMNEREAYLSAAIGIIDAIRSGTTSIFEFSYAFPNPAIYDAILQAFLDIGARGWLGIGVNDTGVDHGLNPALIKPLDELMPYTDKIVDSINRQGQGKVAAALAPSSIRGISGEALTAFADYCRSKNLINSIHINEITIDNEVSQEKFGMPLIPALEKLGVLDGHFLAVHCVQMTAEDISILGSHSIGVSHNPVSNMYLGSGVAPVIAMEKAGVRMSLGVDGAASNNSQDMLETLKYTVLGQRVAQREPACIQAEDALRMATTGGARVLQSEDSLGRLEPGHKADVVALHFNSAKSLPVFDPLSTTVFNSGEENVEMVMIDGKLILDDGRFTTLDEGKLLVDAQKAAEELLERAGIEK